MIRQVAVLILLNLFTTAHAYYGGRFGYGGMANPRSQMAMGGMMGQRYDPNDPVFWKPQQMLYMNTSDMLVKLLTKVWRSLDMGIKAHIQRRKHFRQQEYAMMGAANVGLMDRWKKRLNPVRGLKMRYQEWNLNSNILSNITNDYFKMLPKLQYENLGTLYSILNHPYKLRRFLQHVAMVINYGKHYAAASQSPEIDNMLNSLYYKLQSVTGKQINLSGGHYLRRQDSAMAHVPGFIDRDGDGIDDRVDPDGGTGRN